MLKSLFSKVTSMLSENCIWFLIQNVMAAVFVTVLRLYDWHFPRSGKLRWAGSFKTLACYTCRYSGVSHWSAGTKRASLWLVRLHYILAFRIWATRKIHVHWLKKDELCIVRKRKRGGCRFIRLKEDKRLKRESSDAHE